MHTFSKSGITAYTTEKKMPETGYVLRANCFRHYFFVQRRLLIAQFFADKEYLDPAGMHASSCYNNLAAEAFGGEAVVTDAGCRTGQFPVKADGIGRGGDIPNSGDCALYIGSNFVHAGHYYDMGGALNQAGDTVAVTVDIDQFSV